MASMTPDEIAGQDFRAAFRGFDPTEVRSYLQALSTAVGELVAERDRLSERLEELGQRDLKSEFETIGREVSAVLEAAREAADQMRERATNDATRWRSEAVAEVEHTVRSARADSEQLRGDAWTTADELLKQAIGESDRISATSEKERLRMVGEAERESHRVIAAARRESDDLLRSAKVEADRLTITARTSHDEMIDQATRNADAAQERTRALEIRRQELKIELDSIRHALASAEGELEDRRAALELSPSTPDVESPSPPEEPTPRESADQAEGEWTPGETVRVVRPGVLSSSGRPTGPITDTPEIVVLSPAEVLERQRAADPSPQSTEESEPSEGDEEENDDQEEVDSIAARVDAAANADGGLEPYVPSDDAAEDDSTVEYPVEPQEPEPSLVVPSEPAPDVSDGVPLPGEDTADAIDGSVPDVDIDRFEELSGLFARLREPGEVQPSPTDSPSEHELAAPKETVSKPASSYSGDPFDLRSRLLLPVTNRALRNIKRQLTEAQNEALEELRLSDGEWDPDGPALGARLRPDLTVLSSESYAAGHSGAAEMAGERFKRPTTPKAEFENVWVAGMLSDLNDVLAEGRRQGQGARELGASVSRVFRGWRTDEAERRVAHLAADRYHNGMTDVLISNGYSTAWVVSGRGCTACRSNAESLPGEWDSVPPLHQGCDCTLSIV